MNGAELTPEQAQAVHRFRLKLKAAKGLIRDLSIAAAQLDDLLDPNVPAKPQEAQHDQHTRTHR